jgi:hypothetical protein
MTKGVSNEIRGEEVVNGITCWLLGRGTSKNSYVRQRTEVCGQSADNTTQV